MSTQIDSLEIQIVSQADEAIRKIDELTEALERLRGNTKVGKITTDLRNISSASGKASHGINTLSLNMASLVTVAQGVVGAVQNAVQAISSMMAEAIEWDGIQFRFGRAFGEDAEEVYQYVLKINDVLGINIQQFMQYSSLYGSLLSGFGMAQEKVTTISVGLTELSYDIWAAYNDRFKTLEDASEAVRSAITGEIEPIRNAGIALTEASLQEYIDSTNLAGVSIEKLTEARKSEVRYAAMVNAAMNQGIVGTYAREMNTAEGAVRSLAQSFKGLVQAVGSLFIPILQKVVPIVTAVVELLTDLTFWIASVFGIEMQKIDWGAPSKGIGGMATGAEEAADGFGKASKAAKKLKDYTMGFDELNVISPETPSAGGAGGGVGGASGWGEGLDLDTLWDQSVFDEASRKVDEVKAKILDFFDTWKWGFALIGAGLAAWATYKHWDTITGWFGKISGATRTVIRVFQEISMALKGIPFAAMYPKVQAVVKAFQGAWLAVKGFLAGITAPVWATFAAIVAGIASVAYFLYENWTEVTKAAKDFFAQTIVPKLEDIAKHFEKMKTAVEPLVDIFNDVKDSIKKFFEDIDWSKLDWIGKLFEGLGGIIFGVVSSVIAGAFNVLVGIIESTVQLFSGVVQVVAGVVEFIVALFTADEVGPAWEKIWDGVIDIIGGAVGLVLEPVANLVEGVIEWFTELWDELVGHSIVPDMVNGIVDWFLSLPKKILKPVQDFVNSIIKKFKDMWANIKSWYSTNVAPKFTKEYWATTFNSVKAGLEEKLDEAWEKVKDFFSVSKWKEKVEGAMKAIKDNFKIPSLPKIKLSVEWDVNVGSVKKAVYEALGLPGWPSLKWSTYAMGGFPNMGEMFIAREAGPELVGRIGNRTTVANNDQIVEAVSQGVYSAVVSAMSGMNNGGQNVNVYLDGKQIYASVKKAEAQRGLTLMGNQLEYSF